MSSSLTARLKLFKPDPGSGEPVDVAQLNQAFDTIDAALGPAEVTSTTRPATPYPNQLIRETNTRKLYVWNNTQGSWDEIMTPLTGVTNSGNNTWTGLNVFQAPLTSQGNFEVNGTAVFTNGIMRPTESEDATDITGISSGTPAAGSPVVGHSFTAPPSGMVYVTIGGGLFCANASSQLILGWEMRAGGTVGSGTVFFGTSPDRSLVCGRAASTDMAASRRNRVTGLTPGSVYNVRAMHWMGTGTGGTVGFRNMMVEPIF